MAAAIVVFASADNDPALPPPPPNAGFRVTPAAAQTLEPPVAERPEVDREARRLARYDRDKDGSVSRAEYLTSRQKAFAKLDVNGDGRLAFEEYAVKTIDKFDGADSDDSGRLTAAEFATTAVKRKPARPNCPPAEADGA
ncbi:MAG: histidine kinase [Sphingomonadaceae bacterium]|nr:histidine kinase [Sphingomonadaceae bacterium]